MARDIPGAHAPTPGGPYYITTAIDYPNGAPHIGHAYEKTATDAIARFKRLDGFDVRFLTGTDVHGLKMAETAAAEGIPTADLARRNSDVFQQMQERLNVSFDRFIRTTDADHTAASIEIWNRMNASGDIYLGAYAGWYSVRDERFYTEDELEERADGIRYSIETDTPVTWTEEQTYFFKLSAYGDKLLAHYEAHPEFIGPDVRRNEVLSFVSGGLRDLSISRTTFDWGVQVPDHPDHVMYVWVDALTNYLTGAGFPDTASESFRRYWPADLHVIGKDIIRFHTVYWPAFLMSAGIELPRRVFAHGFINVKGEKMSKSVGNVVDPIAVIDEWGLDAFRFYVVRELAIGPDGNWTDEGFEMRYESELAKKLGNLLNRSLSMLNRYRDGVTPSRSDELAPEAAKVVAETRSLLEQNELQAALQSIWSLVAHANKYIDDTAPFKLAKDPAQAKRLDEVLYNLVEICRILAVLLWLYHPGTAEKMYRQLGLTNSPDQFSASAWGGMPPGQKIGEPTPLFPIKEKPKG